jgi:hypothetical protein
MSTLLCPTQIRLHQQPRFDCPKYKLGTRSVYYLLYKRVVHSSDGGLYVVEASLVKQEQFVNDRGISNKTEKSSQWDATGFFAVLDSRPDL